MRRFWAFLVMLFTILVAVVFNVQSVYTRNNYGVNYDGGTELVFEMTRRENGIALSESDIADKVQKRLDTAGARDGQVSVYLEENAYVNPDGDVKQEPTAYVRVKLPASSVVANVQTVIGGNGPITFSDANDDVLEGATVFGDLSPMEIKNNGTSITPVFNIANATAFQTLMDQAANNDKEDLKKTIYVWQNKTESDTYATGVGDSKRDDVAKKIIGTLSTDDFVAATDTENAYISIGNDGNGNQFNIASAHAYVDARNADDYGYDISFLYSNPVTVNGTEARATRSLIVTGIALAVLWIALIVIYRFSGVLAGLSIAVSLLFTFYLSNVLGFEFTPITILAGLVSVALSLLIVINYFERVKGEIKRGKNLEKANYDGYRKSFPVTLAASLFTLAVALTAFLIGKSETRIFAGVLLIASICDFIFTNYITKWLVYWLTTSSVFNKGERAFGFGTEEKAVNPEPAKEKKPVIEAKKMKKNVMATFIVMGVLALASLGYFLGVGLTSGTNAYYNYSGDYKGNTRLDLSYTTLRDLDQNHTFDDYASFLAYASDDPSNAAYYEEGRTVYFTEDQMVSPTSYTFNRNDTLDENGLNTYTYYISVELKEPLAKDTLEALKGDFAGGTSLNMIPSSYSGKTKVSMYSSSYGKASYDSFWFYLGTGLLPVFMAVLTMAGYGIYAGLAVLGGGALSFGTGTLLLTLCRLPFTSYSFFGIYASLFLFNMALTVLFTYFREEKREGNVAHPSLETRAQMMENARKKSMFTFGAVSVIGIVIGVTLIVINPTSLLSAGIVLIILSMLDFFLGLYVIPYLYLFFVRIISLHKISDKAKARRAKKLTDNPNEPHETIVPGIND